MNDEPNSNGSAILGAAEVVLIAVIAILVVIALKEVL